MSDRDDEGGSRPGVEGLEVAGVPATDGDVITTGGEHRPVRPALFVTIAVLLGALLLGGYLYRRAQPDPTPPPPTPTAVAGPALVATGTTCSTVLDAQLRLGVQVTNRSTEPVTLFHVTAVLPLGGLRPGTTSWLDCGSPTGQPPDQSAPPGDRTLTVPPGGTAWVTMTLDVLVDCPAPLPVQYQVDYARHGQPDVLDLRGFPDLGDVPYPGCTDAPGG